MYLIRKNILRYLSATAIMFYYFAHVNYMRKGKSADYSFTWSPVAATFPFLGLFTLLIKPFENVYFFLEEKTYGNESLTSAKTPYLIFCFFLYFFILSFIRSRHKKIISLMASVQVPNIYFCAFLALLFALPILYLAVSMGNSHYFFTVSMILIYYSSFYVSYVRKKVNF